MRRRLAATALTVLLFGAACSTDDRGNGAVWSAGAASPAPTASELVSTADFCDRLAEQLLGPSHADFDEAMRTFTDSLSELTPGDTDELAALHDDVDAATAAISATYRDAAARLADPEFAASLEEFADELEAFATTMRGAFDTGDFDVPDPSVALGEAAEAMTQHCD